MTGYQIHFCSESNQSINSAVCFQSQALSYCKSVFSFERAMAEGKTLAEDTWSLEDLMDPKGGPGGWQVRPTQTLSNRDSRMIHLVATR